MVVTESPAIAAQAAGQRRSAKATSHAHAGARKQPSQRKAPPTMTEPMPPGALTPTPQITVRKQRRPLPQPPPHHGPRRRSQREGGQPPPRQRRPPDESGPANATSHAHAGACQQPPQAKAAAHQGRANATVRTHANAADHRGQATTSPTAAIATPRTKEREPTPPPARAGNHSQCHRLPAPPVTRKMGPSPQLPTPKSPSHTPTRSTGPKGVELRSDGPAED